MKKDQNKVEKKEPPKKTVKVTDPSKIPTFPSVKLYSASKAEKIHLLSIKIGRDKRDLAFFKKHGTMPKHLTSQQIEKGFKDEAYARKHGLAHLAQESY